MKTKGKWIDKDKVIDEIYYGLDDIGDGDLMDTLGVFDHVYPIWEEVLDELGIDEDELYEGSYGDVEFNLMKSGSIAINLRGLAAEYLEQILSGQLREDSGHSYDKQIYALLEKDSHNIEEAYSRTTGVFVTYDEDGIRDYMKSFIKELV